MTYKYDIYMVFLGLGIGLGIGMPLLILFLIAVTFAIMFALRHKVTVFGRLFETLKKK